MNEQQCKKMVLDDIDWLFYFYEMGKVDVKKSVDPDREWDYILKLRMGGRKDVFPGVKQNEDGTVNCVPPWSLTELLDTMGYNIKQEDNIMFVTKQRGEKE